MVVRRSSGRGGRSGGRGRNKGDGGSLGAKEGQEVSELKRELQASQKELKELRERKASLERECVIYQSQLEVWVALDLSTYMYMYICTTYCKIVCCMKYIVYNYVYLHVHI